MPVRLLLVVAGVARLGGTGTGGVAVINGRAVHLRLDRVDAGLNEPLVALAGRPRHVHPLVVLPSRQGVAAHLGGVEGASPPDGGLSCRSVLRPLPGTLLPVVAAEGALVAAVADALRGQGALQTEGAVAALRGLAVQADALPPPQQVRGQGVGPGAVASRVRTIGMADVDALEGGSVLLRAVPTGDGGLQVVREGLLHRGGHGGLRQNRPEVKHVDGVGVDVDGGGGGAVSEAHRLDGRGHAHALAAGLRPLHLPAAAPLRAAPVQAPRPQRADVGGEVAGALLSVSVPRQLRAAVVGQEVEGVGAAAGVGGVVSRRVPVGRGGATGGGALLRVQVQVEDGGPRGPLLDAGSFSSPRGAGSAGLLGGLGQGQSQLACRTHRGGVRRENRH